MSKDVQAISALATLSDENALHTVLHYLYAPTIEAAAAVADELRNCGFRTEERLGGDGVNWLVLARHEAIPSNELIASTRHFMETLIANVGGEYDGWEAEVSLQTRNLQSLE